MATKSAPESKPASRSKSAPATASSTNATELSDLYRVNFSLTFIPTFITEQHAPQFSLFFSSILGHMLNPGVKTIHRFWRTDHNVIETTIQFMATPKVRLEVLKLIWDAFVGTNWTGSVKIDSREMNDYYRYVAAGRKQVAVKQEDVKQEAVEEEGEKEHGVKKDGAKKDGAKTEGAKTEGAKIEGAVKRGAKRAGAKMDGAKKDAPKKAKLMKDEGS
ncbi:MAG: hypothetical protein LQ350_002744 [Teloschistes chrysophthalmus]|nr:MAG: hypothetical protein LQ350_002744 [Niorma chrysophthalma]